MNQIDMSKYCGNNKKMSKMIFIFNAIEDGWVVKKNKNSYIFSKHKGKEMQAYEEKYLEKFIQKYFKMN